MSEEEIKNSLKEILPEDKRGYFQLFLDEPIGHLDLEIKDSEIYLNNIYVKEKYRRNNHANFMLSVLKSLSEISGYMITGTVEANGISKRIENDVLASWYKNKGFNYKNGKIFYFPKSLYSN